MLSNHGSDEAADDRRPGSNGHIQRRYVTVAMDLTFLRRWLLERAQAAHNRQLRCRRPRVSSKIRHGSHASPSTATKASHPHRRC
ncbi:hypothetical protein TIFTF001_008792 [Ficus carica]|uniref:Uncharacterized protein n=1 Tax=Ficus carica TaxID=3494 RepID=A0AA88AFQ8_FICCA|nr:hypothetical protein TIFTF001_008792 [Ficus carica]